MRRIDERTREILQHSKSAQERYAAGGEPHDRRSALSTGVLTVYRTDADLRCVDAGLDPNDRPYGSLFGRRPDLTNYGVVGFGRLVTPEAWLSTWSGLESRASLRRTAPAVNVPVLLIELSGDQACFPADAVEFAAAFAHDDVTHLRVPGRHFGAPLHRGMAAASTLSGMHIGE